MNENHEQPRPLAGFDGLATRLFREVAPEFFGVLASRNGSIYVEALDELERGLSSGGSLTRTEAVEVIIGVLREHPGFVPNEEFPDAQGEGATLSGQANLIMRRLVETRWLHEPPRPDYQRIVTFDAAGEILLAALRQIARGEPAQFTDKVQIACGTLLNPESFTEQPLGDLEGCVANLQAGLRELRQMLKGIERHIRHLLAAQTLRDNFRVLYDEFSENIGHACYRELVRAQLPTKILRARQRLNDIAADETVLEKMQRELLRRRESLDATAAFNEVRLKLDELERLLESVEPQADEIDRRTAEFARRSFARVRYLQEVTSGHRERVQELFEWVNAHFAGRRLSDLPVDLQIPSLLVAEAGLVSGDSLYSPRLRRSLGEIEPLGDDVTEAQREAALREMESNLRDCLSVSRANLFIEQLAGGRRTRIASADLPIRNDDDIADVVACLLHAGSRDACFSVEVQRVIDDKGPEKLERSAGYLIEPFVVEKK
jgi:hypothetical protein